MPQYYFTPPSQEMQQPQPQFDPEANARLEAYMKEKKAQKKQLRKFGIFFGIAIVLYLAIQLGVSMYMLGDIELKELYATNPIFQICFNMLGISLLAVAVPFGLVALLNKKHYNSPIIPNNTIKPSKCFAWLCFGMGTCICANFVVNSIVTIVKSAFGLQLTQGDMLKPNNLLECIFEFIGLAVIPAICEEFAMRCCTLQLLRKYGSGFAVVVVSVVFGLLHGNVIQFLFAFIIGLVLAYITVKTESIVPALLIHFCNNAMSAVQDTVTLYAGDKITDYVTIGLFVFWIASGIVAGIYLFVKKEFKTKLPKGDTILDLGEKIQAFFLPGMVVPFVLLILLTITTIKKV